MVMAEVVGPAPLAVTRAVVWQNVGAGFAEIRRLEVAEFVVEQYTAPRHHARRDSGIAIGRDVPVVGDGQLRAALVGASVVRGDEAGLALLVQRERQVWRVEDRHSHEYDAGVARHA